MFGILVVDKPPGVSSRDVVNRVQQVVRPDKVGHAGTLDPIATGVLVLGIGAATRLVPFIQRMPKTYIAAFELGRSSRSDDTESPLELLEDPAVPTLGQIERALPQFCGEIMQSPPAYSAIKIGGKRAYKLARAGADVQMAERCVTVHTLSLVAFHYPRLELKIECGSGTYVRSIGRDLAESLGTKAVMSALRRTSVGSFLSTSATPLADITSETLPARVLPAARAVEQLPTCELTSQEVDALGRGMNIERTSHGLANEIAGLGPDGVLVSILIPRDANTLRPRRNFMP